VYVRNQRLKASQSNAPAPTWGMWAGIAVHAVAVGAATPSVGIFFVGPEATLNACGVGVAMLQGHSWAPNPLTGSW